MATPCVPAPTLAHSLFAPHLIASPPTHLNVRLSPLARDLLACLSLVSLIHRLSTASEWRCPLCERFFCEIVVHNNLDTSAPPARFFFFFGLSLPPSYSHPHASHSSGPCTLILVTVSHRWIMSSDVLCTWHGQWWQRKNPCAKPWANMVQISTRSLHARPSKSTSKRMPPGRQYRPCIRNALPLRLLSVMWHSHGQRAPFASNFFGGTHTSTGPRPTPAGLPFAPVHMPLYRMRDHNLVGR